MYTLAQIAKTLRTSPGTLKLYIKDFGTYLSPTARLSGSEAEFTKDDLVVLGRIRQYKAERVPNDEIKKLLKKPAGDKGSLLDRIRFPDIKR